ncbi:Hypothetical protein GLP15_5203 [Giardia lamblia P15]|uniref:Uncharacterized protein n=1 Tax=Giardia intestinalis (strain P15) TaxID=658858 RepID=E1EWD2_GIAIA|nr:Hypothetical protein GLP15_5203 [Giardia lamblia P15]
MDRPLTETCQSILKKILLTLKPDKYISEAILEGEAIAVSTLRSVNPDSGLAFPLSLSIGSIIGDYSPSDTIVSARLPMHKPIRVKIGLYVGKSVYYMGTTIVLGAYDGTVPTFPQLTGKSATCLAAAYIAYLLIVKQVKSQTSLAEVRNIIESVSQHFGVHLLEGVASYCLADNGIDHRLEVFQNAIDQPFVTGFLADGDVFVLDIIVTDAKDTAPRPVQEQPYIYLPPELSADDKIFALGKTGLVQKELQEMRRFPIARRHISQANRRQFDHYKDSMQPFVLTKLASGANIAQILSTLQISSTGCLVLAGPVLPNVVKPPIQPTEEMRRHF